MPGPGYFHEYIKKSCSTRTINRRLRHTLLPERYVADKTLNTPKDKLTSSTIFMNAAENSTGLAFDGASAMVMRLGVLEGARERAFKINEDLQRTVSSRDSRGDKRHGGRSASVSTTCLDSGRGDDREAGDEHGGPAMTSSHSTGAGVAVDDDCKQLISRAHIVVNNNRRLTDAEKRMMIHWLDEYKHLLRDVETSRGAGFSTLNDIVNHFGEINRKFEKSKVTVENELESELGNTALEDAVKLHYKRLAGFEALEEEMDKISSSIGIVRHSCLQRHAELDSILETISSEHQAFKNLPMSEKLVELMKNLASSTLETRTETGRQLIIGSAITNLDKARDQTGRKKKTIQLKYRHLDKLRDTVEALRFELKMLNHKMMRKAEEEEKFKETRKKEIVDFSIMASFFVKEITNCSRSLINYGKDQSARIQVAYADGGDLRNIVMRALAMCDRLHNEKFTSERRKSFQKKVKNDAGLRESMTHHMDAMLTHSADMQAQLDMTQGVRSAMPPAITRTDVRVDTMFKPPKQVEMYETFLTANIKELQSACEEFVKSLQFNVNVQEFGRPMEIALIKLPSQMKEHHFNLLHPVDFLTIKEGCIEKEKARVKGGRQSAFQSAL